MVEGGSIWMEDVVLSNIYSLVYAIANQSLIKGFKLFVDPNSVASLFRPNYVGQ